jgi:hypothetical protein
MKTTIDLPDELVREVKLRALMQGKTLRDLVADFIRQGLGIPTPETSAGLPLGSLVAVGNDGLPYILCSADAPAVGMSADDLLRLEQQAQTAQDLRDARRAV